MSMDNEQNNNIDENIEETQTFENEDVAEEVAESEEVTEEISENEEVTEEISENEEVSEIALADEPKKSKKGLIIAISAVAAVAIAVLVYFGFFFKPTVSDDTVVAKVGGQPVYAYEVAYMVLSSKSYGEELTTEEAINQVGEFKAMVQVAEDNGITLTEEDKTALTDEVNQSMSYYGDEETFNTILSTYGITKDQYMKIGELSKIAYKLQEKAIELGLMAEPTEQETKDYYTNNFLRAKHILFLNTDEEGNELDDAKVLAKATDIYNKIKAGESFDSFADLSEDPGSAANPEGYVFFNTASLKNSENPADQNMLATLQQAGLTMVEEFEQGTAKLKVGEVSEPVKTSYGYHIILRLDVNETEDLYNENKEVVTYILNSNSYENMVDEINAKYPAKQKKIALRGFEKYFEGKKAAADEASNNLQALMMQQQQQMMQSTEEE